MIQQQGVCSSSLVLHKSLNLLVSFAALCRQKLESLLCVPLRKQCQVCIHLYFIYFMYHRYIRNVTIVCLSVKISHCSDTNSKAVEHNMAMISLTTDHEFVLLTCAEVSSILLCVFVEIFFFFHL